VRASRDGWAEEVQCKPGKVQIKLKLAKSERALGGKELAGSGKDENRARRYGEHGQQWRRTGKIDRAVRTRGNGSVERELVCSPRVWIGRDAANWS
jgi:hypothetical protein